MGLTRPGNRDKYDYSPSPSRSPPPRRRSLSQRALGALGIGGAAGSGSRHRDSGRGRSRGLHHRRHSYSPSPSRGDRGDRGGHRRAKSEARIAQAMKAAVTAGAVEAFHARHDPGEWKGPKGKRVLTAALAAGGTDGIIDRGGEKHSKRHLIESTLAGLATNHVVNGSGSRSRSRSRHHGRSKSHGKGKEVAIAGLLAAAGKEAYDKYQKHKSQSRPRRRSDSRGSDDSYESRPRNKKRSKSVSDYINKGMAALGIEEGGDSQKGDRHRDDRHRDDHRRRRRRHRSSRYDDDYSDDDGSSDDEYYRRHPSPPRSRHSKDVSRPYYIPAAGARGDEVYDPSNVGHRSRPGSPAIQDQPRGTRHHGHSHKHGNGSDGESSTDERKKLSKINRETLWATGLAAASTFHAAHSLTENMEKHKERARQVKEGEMGETEARLRRRKNQLSDVASVGVAALSVHSAIGEWKNFESKRKERAELNQVCKQRSKSMGRGSSHGHGHGHGNGHGHKHRHKHSHRHSRRHSMPHARPQRARSLDERPDRTVSPDEIEENWSLPDRRSTVGAGGRSPLMV